MTEKKHILLLGGHMSIAGGLEQAIIRGESIGCTAIQIFVKSNRQWAARDLTDEEIVLFKETWKQSSVSTIIAHAAYLINIGSPNKAARKKSINALVFELKRCEQLSIPHLVLHPGSRLNSTPEECYLAIAQGLDEIFDKNSGKTTILLENMAGQGSNVGNTFEGLAQIYHHVHYKKRVGFCFDTCHAFAAGYDIATKDGYKETWDAFDKILGLNKLMAIHLNDSKKELGSKLDRHEDIGKGQIGAEGFRLLVNDDRFVDIPKALETPKGKNALSDDAKNMRDVVHLLAKKNQKLIHNTPLEIYLK